MTPPLLLYIPWARRLVPFAPVVISNLSDVSCITYPLPTPPSSSLIPRPVLLCQRLRCCCQYPEPVNTPAPPLPETFTWTHCLFCLLSRRLRCCRRDLGLIFLCRHSSSVVVTEPSTPQFMSPIPWTRCLFLVLF